MKPISSLARAVAIASLVFAGSFTAQAADVPIGSEALESHVTTQVQAIDLEKRLVTVQGANDKPVTFQLTEKAKALPNLKVGDTVDIKKIDLKQHEVSLLPPEGKLQVVKVENPDLQARMKNLKVGQTVDAIYTEVLRVETSR